MKILIAEEESEARTTLVRWLTTLGHEPVLAATVPEMLDLLKGGGVDRLLVSVDPRSPSPLLQAIKGSEIRVPMLVASMDENVRDLITLVTRAQAVPLSKPFQQEDLAQAIEASAKMSPLTPRPQSAGQPTVAAKPGTAAGPGATTAASATAAKPAAASKPAAATSAAAGSAAPAAAGGVRAAVIRLLEDLKQGKVKLPVLDPRVGKIQSLMNRKDVELKEVVDVIGRDPTLTASVLRLANSSFYMQRTPVKDIKDACVRLGNKNVFSIAFEVLLRNQFSAHKQPFRTIMSQIWQNALVTSRFASRLAVMVRYPQPEELHAPAFLHNIGELMLIQLFADLDDPRANAPEELGAEINRLHQQLGAVLAKSWNLPPTLVRIVGNHHQPAENPEPEDQRLMRCLVLASWNLAIASGFPYLSNTEPVGLDELLAGLGIDPASLTAMREEARNWGKE